MYPPSSDVMPDGWLTTTDGAVLMANALVYAGTAPVNTAPTINAGADQSIEAGGPGGVPFTLTATGADGDGDPLAFGWSGALAGSGATLTGTLALPAAPVKSQVYFFTVTVDDGHGHQASDVVTVTVSDTTAPVLSNMPQGVIVAPATSASGATVPYGPVAATDTVDGTVPVWCTPAGPVFPIGDTTVTCTASDTRGNSSSASFIVRVTNAATVTPGLMFGAGFVRQGGLSYDFEFIVRERASGADRAALGVRVSGGVARSRRDDRFVAYSADSVVFDDDPTIRPGFSTKPQVDTVVFSGRGEWNGRSGYRYEVRAQDAGEPGRHRESIRIVITAPNGAVLASVDGALTGGNIESARLRR